MTCRLEFGPYSGQVGPKDTFVFKVKDWYGRYINGFWNNLHLIELNK